MASLFERLRKALRPKYTLEREIASGGMGVVFLGENTKLRSRVAIKALRPELATAAMEARFQREARLLAQLSHPNIVTIHDVDVADGVHYYVMDYIEGETLSQKLERGPMDPDDVLSLGQDLLSALETVHALNVVHRDIKPANIFLVGGKALLVDFGIAHVDHTESDETRPGQAPGTPAYMPPEQRFGVTSQTDLYALGMVLYECSTGSRWHQIDDSEEGNWISVPQPLAKALRKSLKHDPQERWADAASFRAALTPTDHPDFPITAVGIVVAIALAVMVLINWDDLKRVWDPTPSRVDLAISDFEVVGTTSDTGTALARLVRRRLNPIPNLTLNADGNADGTIARLSLTGTLAHEADGWILSGTYMDSALDISHHYRFGTGGDSPNALADSVALEIVRLYFAAFRDRVDLPSRNIEALGAWFSGEVAFQKDMWYQAERYFGEAIRHDPEFALAAWRRYNARQWSRRPIDIDLKDLYDRNKDAFSQLDRLLIRAELEPDLETRLLIYDSAVTAYPDDYYAALQRGNELFHRGPLVGRSLMEGLDALADAQLIEPLLAPAYNQSLWGAIRLGLNDVALDLLRKRLIILNPDSSHDIDAGMLFSWSFLERFMPAAAMGTRLDVMNNPTSDTARQVVEVFRLAPSLDIPGTAIDLGQWIAHEETFLLNQQATNGRLGAGLSLIMVGQPLAALDQIDLASASTNDAELVAEEARLLLPLFGIIIPEAERDRARNLLTEWSKGGKWSQRASWALAVDALHRKATSEYTKWRRTITDPNASDTYRLSLGEVLDVLKLGHTDPRSAVDSSREITAIDSAGRGIDPFARALLYWHRAEWLEELGQLIEAERTWLWYENSDFGAYPARNVQAAEIDWIIGSYARLRRAKVQLLLPNRTADACHHLKRVVELWADAEPDILPLRQEAESLIADSCAA